MKLLVPVVCTVLIGCASAPKTTEAAIPIGDAGTSIGIDWLLLEIRQGDTVIDLNRPRLAAEEMGDVFSLRFDGGTVSGKAAPNRYSAPCEWGDDNTIAIGLMVSTKMAASREPEALKEHAFFAYLARVNRLALNGDGQLELYAEAGANGAAATLVFGRKDLYME
jgi:heat shock protein HslJ